ncbi:hypothetical protein [Amycolatopsis jiangsuensis]|uniref:Uncharacterized protein n=1 Tax=Amycolatopsis jiangsuensis TaxID=1181879 RepID=A0A840J6E0_9PSEU|nr:hypothetical protein [Amycolatopsis jiangsuensis]MBB4688974.1 hypothetical protein [Amycolatopsis jiangsuensis]
MLVEEDVRALDDVRRGLVVVRNGLVGAGECYLWSAGGRVPPWETAAVDRLRRRGLVSVTRRHGAATSPLVASGPNPG